MKIRNSCKERFASVVEALEQLDREKENERILVSLDGRCASGKSTLGIYLQELFEANLFHMDDFFLQPHQRTPERMAEVGGNVDYERFQAEVLEPVKNGERVFYRRFDCKTMTMTEGRQVEPKRINIIEGSYSRNPYFGEVYDLAVFTDIDEENQIKNIRARNGEEKLETFRKLWIPKEEAYFEKYQIKERSDIVVEWRNIDDIHGNF